MPQQFDFNTEDYAELLLIFIRKNKKIPNAIAACETSQEEAKNVTALRNAILQNDPNAAIFSHPNCIIYTIYLLKNNEITLTEAITLFTYLMVLMQYTDKQALPTQYQAEKAKVSNVEVFTQKDTDKVNEYLTHLKSTKFFYDTLQESGTSIQRLQWYITLPISDNTNCIPSILLDLFKRELSNECLLHFTNQHVTIPPFTIYEKISDHQHGLFKLVPFFGRISEATQKALHHAKIHPISIASSQVKNNPGELHGFLSGPVPYLLHDIYAHGVFGLSYQLKEHTLIYSYIIPAMETLKQKAKYASIANDIQNLTDGIDDLQNIKSNFPEYLFFNNLNSLPKSSSLFPFIYDFWQILLSQADAIKQDTGYDIYSICKQVLRKQISLNQRQQSHCFSTLLSLLIEKTEIINAASSHRSQVDVKQLSRSISAALNIEPAITTYSQDSHANALVSRSPSMPLTR